MGSSEIFSGFRIRMKLEYDKIIYSISIILFLLALIHLLTAKDVPPGRKAIEEAATGIHALDLALPELGIALL
jgi:hypothetical protein